MLELSLEPGPTVEGRSAQTLCFLFSYKSRYHPLPHTSDLNKLFWPHAAHATRVKSCSVFRSNAGNLELHAVNDVGSNAHNKGVSEVLFRDTPLSAWLLVQAPCLCSAMTSPYPAAYASGTPVVPIVHPKYKHSFAVGGSRRRQLRN